MLNKAIDRDVGNRKISQNVLTVISWKPCTSKFTLVTSYTSQELYMETLSDDSLESVTEFIK